MHSAVPQGRLHSVGSAASTAAHRLAVRRRTGGRTGATRSGDACRRTDAVPCPAMRHARIAAAVLLLALAGAGCGRSTPDDTARRVSTTPSTGAKGTETTAAQDLGFPTFATKNTTRIGGADPVADAAAAARAGDSGAAGTTPPPPPGAAPHRRRRGRRAAP